MCIFIALLECNESLPYRELEQPTLVVQTFVPAFRTSMFSWALSYIEIEAYIDVWSRSEGQCGGEVWFKVLFPKMEMMSIFYI